MLSDEERIAQLESENKKLKSDLNYANLTINSLVQWSDHLEEIMVSNGIHLTANGNVVKENA